MKEKQNKVTDIENTASQKKREIFWENQEKLKTARISQWHTDERQ